MLLKICLWYSCWNEETLQINALFFFFCLWPAFFITTFRAIRSSKPMLMTMKKNREILIKEFNLNL
jgi:hypothetical protein